MTDTDDNTRDLLKRWYAGDQAALEALLEQNMGWMRAHIRGEISPKVRRKLDTMDVVQDGVVRLLKYGPKFAPENQAQFRALISTILVTAFRDRIDHLRAGIRDMDREHGFPDHGLSRMDILERSVTRPDAASERNELQEWIQLGLELLDPDDRKVIRLRQFEQHSFAQVAELLELPNADTARMRFNRALPKLAEKIKEMQSAVAGTKTGEQEES
jgi:RNA polymerase sigma factor (sigma-70 family)